MTRPELTGIHWVRLSFVDVFGTGNSVQIPATRYDEAAERGTPFDGSALEGRARYLESDMLLRPVPATLVELGDGIARVVCTAHTPDGTRWTGDPRFALESLLDDVGEVGEQLTVAAELEFYLLDLDDRPVDSSGYFDELESVGTAVARDAAEQLVACGIAVDACHHEAGPGQYELDVAPLTAIGLADGLVLAKQIVRDRARANGMRATFMPATVRRPARFGPPRPPAHGGPPRRRRRQPRPRRPRLVAGQLTHGRGLSPSRPRP